MENLNNKFGEPPLSLEVLNESQMLTKVKKNWEKWNKKEWKKRFEQNPTDIANEYRFVATNPELWARYSDEMRKIFLLMNKIILKNIIQLPQPVIDTIKENSCFKFYFNDETQEAFHIPISILRQNCSGSPYFKGLLEGNFKEKEAGEVHLKQMGRTSFQKFFEWLTFPSPSCFNEMDINALFEFLEDVAIFEIPGLTRHIDQTLKEKTTIENVISVINVICENFEYRSINCSFPLTTQASLDILSQAGLTIKKESHNKKRQEKINISEDRQCFQTASDRSHFLGAFSSPFGIFSPNLFQQPLRHMEKYPVFGAGEVNSSVNLQWEGLDREFFRPGGSYKVTINSTFVENMHMLEALNLTFLNWANSVHLIFNVSQLNETDKKWLPQKFPNTTKITLKLSSTIPIAWDFLQNFSKLEKVFIRLDRNQFANKFLEIFNENFFKHNNQIAIEFTNLSYFRPVLKYSKSPTQSVNRKRKKTTTKELSIADFIICIMLTEGTVRLFEKYKEFCVYLKDEQLLHLLEKGKIDLTAENLDLSHSKYLTSKSLSKLFQSMPNLTDVNLSYLSSGDYDRLINGENQLPQDLNDKLNWSAWLDQVPQLLLDIPNLSTLELPSDLCMRNLNLGINEWNTWQRLIIKYFSDLRPKTLIIKLKSNLSITLFFHELMPKYPHGRIELILADELYDSPVAAPRIISRAVPLAVPLVVPLAAPQFVLATPVPITGYKDLDDYRVTFFGSDSMIELKLDPNSRNGCDFDGVDGLYYRQIKYLTSYTQPILNFSYLKDYGKSKVEEFCPQYMNNPLESLAKHFDHIKQINLFLNRFFLSTYQWTFDDLLAFRNLKTIEIEIDPEWPFSDFLQLFPNSNLYQFLQDKSYVILFKQTEFETALIEEASTQEIENIVHLYLEQTKELAKLFPDYHPFTNVSASPIRKFIENKHLLEIKPGQGKIMFRPTKLYLNHLSKITDVGLVEFLRSFSSISSIDLRGCAGLTQKSVDLLNEKYPNIIIHLPEHLDNKMLD
jgi:hypothetical protein